MYSILTHSLVSTYNFQFGNLSVGKIQNVRVPVFVGIQIMLMWTKITSNLKSMQNNNLPNLLFGKYIFQYV